MTNRPHTYRDTAEHYADEAARRGESAVGSARDVAWRARERFLDAQAEVGPALEHATHHASHLAHRGIDALREGSGRLRDRTLHASRYGLDYARHKPVKTALLVVGVVAAAISVIALLRRAR